MINALSIARSSSRVAFYAQTCFRCYAVRKQLPEKDTYLNTLRSLILSNQTISPSEWSNVRCNLLAERNFNSNNIDSTIIAQCVPDGRLDIAMSYMQYLRQSGQEANIATIGKLLRVYASVSKGYTLSIEHDNDVQNIYQQLMKKSDILDQTTCENLIYALAKSKEWKKCLDLLDMIKITSVPTVGTYTSLICRAFAERDANMAWDLLKENLTTGKMPHCDSFIAYIDNYCADPNIDSIEALEKMLKFLSSNEVHISKKVIEHVKNIFEQNGYHCSFTSVEQNGKCRNCNTFLNEVKLSTEEFNELREFFIQKVIVRRDIFHKTSPEELKSFETFLEKTVPYDCVIDGLNVAYSCGSNRSHVFCAKLLANVVKYFIRKGERVLVLGRKHMNSWPKKEINFIKNNASLFLTDDLSQDDPYLLYAALYSGPTTDYLSRDFMRNHGYLLGSEYQQIFRRWQYQHHNYLINANNGQVLIRNPIKFSSFSQCNGLIWHIPFISTYLPNQLNTFEMPQSWLCVQSKNKIIN